MSWYQEQIAGCTYRKFTTGFFYGKPSEEAQIYDNNTYEKGYTYLGFAEAVDERGLVQITQRNKFLVGETIEIMKPDGTNLLVTVKAIYDEEGNSLESAPHPQQKLFVDLGGGADVYDILRRGEAKKSERAKIISGNLRAPSSRYILPEFGLYSYVNFQEKASAACAGRFFLFWKHRNG